MNRAALEKNLATVLFVIVLVVFSFAQRDSKKMEQMYTASQLIKKGSNIAFLNSSADHQP